MNMIKRRMGARIHWRSCALAVWIGMAGAQPGRADNLVLPFAGADGPLSPGWQPMVFDNIPAHTRYGLVQEGDQPVLMAEADNSASGLIHRLDVGVDESSILRWRWKVSGVLRRGDVTQRDGDDYPARIYVTFAFDESRLGWGERLKLKAARLIYGDDVPFAAINYIWASRAPVGTLVPNAYTDRVRMIVVDSGAGKAGQWQAHARNLYEDFKAAFGFEPTGLTGIAVMTDTDNTGERVTAWYNALQLENITLKTSSNREAK